MKAIDKAWELVNKYWLQLGVGEQTAARAALIAVDEIIKALRSDLPEVGKGKGYWAEVKQELEKIKKEI